MLHKLVYILKLLYEHKQVWSIDLLNQQFYIMQNNFIIKLTLTISCLTISCDKIKQQFL